MIKLLIRRFIPDYENTGDRIVREKYSVLSGILGIICNAFLFALKLFIGLVMNSISITSDAFNNLSDMGSSLVTIFGAKLSNKRPDKDHPFGHGRIEYISSFIVSGLIIVVGVELLKSSFDKIIHPSPITFRLVLVIILTASLLVKLWMFLYNRYMGAKINSSVLKATASDSISDCFATAVVIIASVVGHYAGIPLDGYLGAIVAIMIIIAGVKVAKEVIDELLGKPPEKETVELLSKLVTEDECIVGCHDLIVHNYGPGRTFASVHAEVPDDSDIVHAHEVIDEVEQKIYAETGIIMTIHMDPVSVGSETVEFLKGRVREILDSLNPVLSFHDFRITDGENRVNLIFDMVVPAGTPSDERNQYIGVISEKMKEIDRKYYCVIKVDEDYT